MSFELIITCIKVFNQGGIWSYASTYSSQNLLAAWVYIFPWKAEYRSKFSDCKTEIQTLRETSENFIAKCGERLSDILRCFRKHLFFLADTYEYYVHCSIFLNCSRNKIVYVNNTYIPAKRQFSFLTAAFCLPQCPSGTLDNCVKFVLWSLPQQNVVCKRCGMPRSVDYLL